MSDATVNKIFSVIVFLIGVGAIVACEWSVADTIENDSLRKLVVENGLKDMVHLTAVLIGAKVMFLRLIFYLIALPCIIFGIYVFITECNDRPQSL